MAGGISLRSAFDWRTGRTIMLVLLVMAASLYAGTLFGNQAPIYVSQLTTGNKNYNNNNCSSSLGASSSTFSPNRNSVKWPYKRVAIFRDVAMSAIFATCLHTLLNICNSK